MNTIRKRAGLLFAVVLTLAPLADAQQAAADNLVANPGFEQGEEGRPAQWGWMDPLKLPGRFEWDWADDHSYEGDRAVKIIARNTTRTASAYWTQTIEVKPETKYIATARMRATTAHVLLWIVGLDGEGRPFPRAHEHYFDRKAYRHAGSDEAKVLKGFVKDEYITELPANTWGTISLSFTTGPGIHKISLRIGSYFKDGTMWFDQVSLEEAE